MEQNKEIIVKEPNQIIEKNITDAVLNKITAMENNNRLQLPPNYVVGNALKSAYLILNNTKDKNGVNIMQSCNKDSIANALLKMAILGLNPAKDQAYFVAYGKDLTLLTSYFGKITAIKRIKGVIDVRADVIYQDTEYDLECDEFGNDSIVIKKPCPLDKRSSDKIIAAWAKIIFDPNIWGSKEYSCIMTIDEIKKAWEQGATKGNSPAHKNFATEMCKKSVINRCIKNYINSCDDQDIIINNLKETIKDDYEDRYDNQSYFEKEEETIDFDINGNVEEADFDIKNNELDSIDFND